MPSNEENQPNIYGEEEEEEESEEDDEEEEDLNSDSPSTSSEDPNKYSNTIAIETPLSTTITASAPNGSNLETPPPLTDPKPIEEKKPSAFDDSRRLFQRLWTDEDEIGLLRGFLEYTTQRGSQNSSYHIDTALFYDQIKNRLQLDFNKNQLVEKLRRLKKKFRNAMNRVNSGKDLSFKSPHDQTTFEISHKIWGGVVSGGGGVEETTGVEDVERKPLNSEINHDYDNGVNVNYTEKKVPRSRKRSRQRVEEDELPNVANTQENSSIPNVIEDTVRSCLSPLLKELVNCATNGSCKLGGLGGGVAFNPLQLNFGGNSSMNFLTGEGMDEKWRKQQILELEVYSKRIELVQDQIKSALEELKSTGSG